MLFHEYIPFWSRLTPEQQQLLEQNIVLQSAVKGQLVHNGTADCVGMLAIVTGQMRGFSMSDDGREVTLYRLFPRDMCVLSAYCVMNSLEFDVAIQAEKDSTFYRIPPQIYKQLMQESAPVACYTAELIATRFSDVMWLLDQILHKHIDSRLAAFLLSEARLEETSTIHLTHEELAHHLGSAREVVSRMLKYFSLNGMVELGRGSITLMNEPKLLELAQESIR